MNVEFRNALDRVLHDIGLDDGEGADLVAVGIDRQDCLELMEQVIAGEPFSPELLAMLVQVSVAVGVWVERERWEDD